MSRPRSIRTRVAGAFAAVSLATVLLGAAALGLALHGPEAAGHARPPAEGAVAPRGEDGPAIHPAWRTLGVAALLAVGGSLLVGWWVAARILAPLREAAWRIRAARATREPLELPERGIGDEWDRLIAVLNDMLRDQRRWAERARGFGATVAHELRTPLTVMMGEVEVALRRERPAEAYRAVLVRVDAEARRMVRVLDAIFTVARADAGELSSAATTFDLADVARRAGERARPRLEASGRRLSVYLEPAEAVGDPELAARVLDNLLDNALKYGGDDVELLVASGDGEGCPFASVSDDGAGLPEAVRARAFERYNRGQGSRGGLGLGLFIARAMAEAQGGSLRLSGPPGTTRFTLVLPGTTP